MKFVRFRPTGRTLRKLDARLKRWEVKQAVADIAEEDKRY